VFGTLLAKIGARQLAYCRTGVYHFLSKGRVNITSFQWVTASVGGGSFPPAPARSCALPEVTHETGPAGGTAA